MLIKPSDMRALLIDLPSPLPFNKLGVDGEYVRWESSLGVFDFLDRDFSFANGLGGKLLDLLSPLGGCGNELMLTVFLSVFPAAFTALAPESPFS